jgi:hypothetical protein
MMCVAVFLVVREEQRAIFSRLRRGEDRLSAARHRPIGTFHLFADVAAAPGTPP